MTILKKGDGDYVKDASVEEEWEKDDNVDVAEDEVEVDDVEEEDADDDVDVEKGDEKGDTVDVAEDGVEVDDVEREDDVEEDDVERTGSKIGTHTLCEPAPWTCTQQITRTTWYGKFTGQMPQTRTTAQTLCEPA